MTEEKSKLESARELISQLKEMHHYSKNNIETLAQHSLAVDDVENDKSIVERVNKLLNIQNDVYELLGELITDWETLCNRVENEA